MSNYSEIHLIKAQERIRNKYNLSDIKSKKVALDAIKGLDSHGGDCSDWLQIKSVIDVVVKSWVEDPDIEI